MANSVMDLKKEIIRLRVALADTEALEIGTAERLEKVTAQLESEKISRTAWEKQHLLEYSEVVQELDRLRAFCEFAWRDIPMNEYAFAMLEEALANLKEKT